LLVFDVNVSIDQLMGKGGNVTSAGWQVTLCDPMWHVSSRSGVATLRTAIHLLLTCYLIVYSVLSTLIKKIFVYIAEKGTSVWNSVPNSRLRQFCSGTSIAAAWVQLNSTKVDVQCDKLASVVGLTILATHSTQIGHFGDVSQANLLVWYGKKLNPTQ